MKFLIIDTETNGIMDYAKPADHPDQPRVAEFAGLLVDESGEIEGEYQRYIKPPMLDTGPEWLMTEETTAINGITNQSLWNDGVPIKEVLDWYSMHIAAGRAVVAFGAQFDCKMMRSELRRAGMDDLFERTPNICLMRSARPFAKQIGRQIIKAGGSNKGWVKLTDLCAFCGVPVGPKLHGGLEDARLAALCFRYMLDNGFIPEPDVHHAKNYEEIKANV